jgi:hypothetical protein
VLNDAEVIQDGIMDALEKKYLKSMMFIVFLNLDEPDK